MSCSPIVWRRIQSSGAVSFRLRSFADRPNTSIASASASNRSHARSGSPPCFTASFRTAAVPETMSAGGASSGWRNAKTSFASSRADVTFDGMSTGAYAR